MRENKMKTISIDYLYKSGLKSLSVEKLWCPRTESIFADNPNIVAVVIGNNRFEKQEELNAFFAGVNFVKSVLTDFVK